MKKLSKETPGAEDKGSGGGGDAEDGDGDGDGDESSPDSESEWSPSETDRLREGIKEALSCLAPYKTHWPHVRVTSIDTILLMGSLLSSSVWSLSLLPSVIVSGMS